MRTSSELFREVFDLETKIAKVQGQMQRNILKTSFLETKERFVAAEERFARASALVVELEEEEAELESESDLLHKKLKSLGAAEGSSQGLGYRNVEALSHEIDVVHARVEELDVAALEAIERYGSAVEEQAQANDSLSMTYLALEEAETAWKSELAMLNKTLSELQKLSGEALAEFDVSSRDLYQRSISNSPRVFALLDGDSCGSCRVKLSRLELDRLSKLGDVGLNQRIRCEECGLFLLT